MIHPDTEVRRCRGEIGYGIFATAPIPMGTITFAKDPLDIDVTPAMYEQLSRSSKAHVEKYSYLEASGNRVLSWDTAKYVNHSCEANSLSTGWGFEIAIRNIDAGEELTDDYGLFNMSSELLCGCDAPRCRKRIHSRDMSTHVARWDEQIRTAIAAIADVRQPLYTLLDAATRDELEEVFERQDLYRSVAALRLAVPSGFSVGPRA